jgi:hypothetical protein
MLRKQQLEYLKQFSKYALDGITTEFFGGRDSWLRSNKNQWKGQSCIIMGNGPSLKDCPNELIKKLPSFGTNGIFLKVVPDFYVTISKDFYKNHFEAICGLENCEKFIANTLPDLLTGAPNEHLLECHWNRYGSCFGWNYPVPLRFSRKADRVVYLGGTVLFICLQLAYWMGFSTVYLLGVDHKFGFPRSEAVYGGRRLVTEGEDSLHFDPNYSMPGYTPHCDMIAAERSFELALGAFNRDSRKIINLTPGTGLDVIPTGKIEDHLG